MSSQVDWHITEDDGEVLNQPRQPLPPSWRRGGIILLVLLILGAGWVWWRLYSVEVALRDRVQEVLDFEHEAFLAGDGELFFSVYEDDLAFQSAQLHPQQQVAHEAGWRVVSAELHDNRIWATLSTEVNGVTQQRITFFEETAYGLRHLANDPAYWGEEQTSEQVWGKLRVRQADAQWAQQMEDTVIKGLQGVNLQDIPLFSLSIRPDFEVSPSPNLISYPSPQLVGLDASGEPTAEYWAGLERAITSRFTPVTIRYAIPLPTPDHTITQLFERLANEFVAQHGNKNVSVELVPAEALTGAPHTWLPTVDAAVITQ